MLNKMLKLKVGKLNSLQVEKRILNMSCKMLTSSMVCSPTTEVENSEVKVPFPFS